MIPLWHIFHLGFDLFLSSRRRAVIDRANWNNCRISLCHHFCQQKMRQKKGKTSFYQTKLGFKEAFSLKEIRQGRKNTPHFFLLLDSFSFDWKWDISQDYTTEMKAEREGFCFYTNFAYWNSFRFIAIYPWLVSKLLGFFLIVDIFNFFSAPFLKIY